VATIDDSARTPEDRDSEWRAHRARAGPSDWHDEKPPEDPEKFGHSIEPWLSALFQAEHLNLLVGNGVTTAVAALAGSSAAGMNTVAFQCELADAVDAAAAKSAKACGRGSPNLEDQVRAARELIAGLAIIAAADKKEEDTLPDRAKSLLTAWEREIDARLSELLKGILDTERGIRDTLESQNSGADEVRRVFGSFLLSFASRTATRERLHIFTTNYDRLIEFGCDLLGLRVLDRFVGRLTPVFRASRLGVDLHYNPPGIRGEPRYLEGVVRLTKLHGSIDWRQDHRQGRSPCITRVGLPFGAPDSHPDLPKQPREGLIVYPNPAKDVETLDYPYAELFRDFAAAACQPNGALVTYGYGFGDDHINRVLRDMLTIPSTHLAIISFDGASGRIQAFCDSIGRPEQITLLMGHHFGDLRTLVEHYLPKPAIDRTTWRMVELLNRRRPHQSAHDAEPAKPEDGGDS
jgi:hypothetical protein